MYRKINIYVNDKYVSSTNQFKNLKQLRQRIRADKRIFVHSIPDYTVDVCDYDKLTLKYE